MYEKASSEFFQEIFLILVKEAAFLLQQMQA